MVSARELSLKEKGLQHKLLIIKALIFFLPILIFSYIFYRNNIFLESSQIVILALTFMLGLGGLVILRETFDRFLQVATAIKHATITNHDFIGLQKDTAELHDITISFNSIMKQFKEANKELQQRVFELFSIKEITEIASSNLNSNELLSALLEKAMAVTMAQSGSVFAVDSRKKEPRFITSIGVEPGPEEDAYVTITESLTRLAATENKPLTVHDIGADSRIHTPHDSPCKTLSF